MGRNSLDIAIKAQAEALEDIRIRKLPLDDDATVNRVYRFYTLKYDADTRILTSFAPNEKKVTKARREAGFFANTTHGLNISAMTVQHHYALRDEQEKYFTMIKGILGADRQRNSTELGKEGRLFVLFVAQILGCYLAYVRKAFGFDIPEGCSPEYVVRRTNKGKPGRPRKNELVVKES